MDSKARLLGHPVHQMLVVFPLGLFGGSFAFDMAALALDNPTLAVVAFWLIVGGLVGALAAAPFGVIDATAIPPGTRAARIALLHGAGNGLVTALFAGSWWLRRGHEADPGGAAIALSGAAVALSLVTAWLGGELVTRLGVGVSSRAHVDASSSIGDDARS